MAGGRSFGGSVYNPKSFFSVECDSFTKKSILRAKTQRMGTTSFASSQKTTYACFPHDKRCIFVFLAVNGSTFRQKQDLQMIFHTFNDVPGCSSQGWLFNFECEVHSARARVKWEAVITACVELV